MYPHHFSGSSSFLSCLLVAGIKSQMSGPQNFRRNLIFPLTNADNSTKDAAFSTELKNNFFLSNNIGMVFLFIFIFQQAT